MLNYISLFVSAILFAFLIFLKKKKVSFGNRVFIAMTLGIALGTIFSGSISLVEPIGSMYVNLIKMIVIPLVISSVITSISSLESTEKLKKIGFKTLAYLMGTTAAATIIGIGVALLFNLGHGIQFVQDAAFKAKEVPTFTKVLIDMVPSNPVNEMANGKIIPVIIFSILIGIAILIEGQRKPEKVQPVKSLFESFATIMFRITKMVLKLTPYGVYALMAGVASKYGISTLLPLGKVIIAIYIACLLQILLVHGSLLAFVAKVNPIKFFKKIYEPQVVAFTTRSSYGTLPATIKALTDKVGVSNKIASFVAPMGATMGMNGCGGLYPVMAAVFVANVFGQNFTITNYITLIIVTTIASIGTAGVPGTASIMTTVVLAAMGLPVEGIALLLGIDTIVDMARTATNVTGASVVSLLVANSVGEFDREHFNNDSNTETNAVNA
jgi:Na+/H+-dicarboxylate symporter